MSLSWGAVMVQYFSGMEFCWPLFQSPPRYHDNQKWPLLVLAVSGDHTVPIENVLDTEPTES